MEQGPSLLCICRAARHAAAESSDDEEHFSKKEAARLARDKARLNPLTLGGGQAGARKGGTGGTVAWIGAGGCWSAALW